MKLSIEVDGSPPDSTRELEILAGGPDPLGEQARGRRPGSRLALVCLLVILAVQAGLSLRLIWSNTAFIDEATYMYAGGQEIGHWLHGALVEDYQTFLSGSPVVYPPLAAIANRIGGLTAGRLLSLAFMLGCTALLYAAAAQLFGRRAALLAAALFASLGVTQFLSAFATYDAMALFLLALACYLVVSRGYEDGSLPSAVYASVFAPAALVLANAAKYATALWDPVVIGLALCVPVLRGQDWRAGAARAARFAGILAILIAGGIGIGKGKYLAGIVSTTVARSSRQPGMGRPASLVLHAAWTWGWVFLVLAAAGALLLCLPRTRAALVVTGALLLFAAVAAPLNQARIGTAVSLQKHLVFGAWFGCMLGGYALAKVLRYRALLGACGLALVTALPACYTRQATALYHTWAPENPAFVAGLRRLVHPGGQRYLIDGHADIPAYYVGPAVTSLQWKETASYGYVDPGTGAAYAGARAFADAIRHQVFGLIILNFHDRNDFAVAAAIGRYGGYRLIGQLPAPDSRSHFTYTVWQVAGGHGSAR